MHYIYSWSQMYKYAQNFYNLCVILYHTKARSLTYPPHLLYISRNMYHLLFSFPLSMPKELLHHHLLFAPSYAYTDDISRRLLGKEVYQDLQRDVLKTVLYCGGDTNIIHLFHLLLILLLDLSMRSYNFFKKRLC